MSYTYPLPLEISFTLSRTGYEERPQVIILQIEDDLYAPPIGTILVSVEPHISDGGAVNFIVAPEAVIAVVEGDCSFEIPITVVGTVTALDPVVGDESSVIDVFFAGVGSHGVAGSCECSIGFSVEGEAVHVRYDLKGEVRFGGALVNRRVRAYRRSDGALVAERDTIAGSFVIPVGFVEDEFYILPINMATDADDFAPPCSNRVTSILAMDTV